MYTTVVLPIDGSEHSRRAEQTALNIADTHDAELHVLHVVNTRRYSEPVLSTMELVTDEAEDRAMALLERVMEKADDRDLDVVSRCCHGVPHEEIKRYAEEVDADIIVMGYQGRTHNKKMGRVADRVVRDTSQETLTV